MIQIKENGCAYSDSHGYTLHMYICTMKTCVCKHTHAHTHTSPGYWTLGNYFLSSLSALLPPSCIPNALQNAESTGLVSSIFRKEEGKHSVHFYK